MPSLPVWFGPALGLRCGRVSGRCPIGPRGWFAADESGEITVSVAVLRRFLIKQGLTTASAKGVATCPRARGENGDAASLTLWPVRVHSLGRGARGHPEPKRVMERQRVLAMPGVGLCGSSATLRGLPLFPLFSHPFSSLLVPSRPFVSSLVPASPLGPRPSSLRLRPSGARNRSA
jgi:hypothetical protein